ncbi:hypothetical protein QBC35DRAFT_384843 [Podospora australis]|uniref:Uncharacterized protein n=1 Tax=Podospora australis TaxID=1536484 RepID=A0AAN7AG83_9PEZI|nr:hypothetical protein QBC35DRAFT_384843 [Podospora australis]
MPQPTLPSSHPPPSDSDAGSKPRPTRKSEPPAKSPLLPAVKLRKKLSAGILTTSTSSTGARAARITTTASACPAAAATAISRNPLSKPSLKQREQNAPQSTTSKVMRPGSDSKGNPSSTARTTTARMPSYERPTVAGQTRQPQMPPVGRTVNTRSPLTPKVAGTRPPAPQHQNNPTLGTPLPRRPRPGSLQSTLTANGAGSRDTPELTSPVSAFLASNITPRSGSRQSRVESANSTPNGTPNPDRHNDTWDTKSGVGMSPPSRDDGPRRPVVTFSPASDVSGVGRSDLDSKFFYAADAQRQPPPLQQLPSQPEPQQSQQSRGATFFYASGGPITERQVTSPGPVSPSLSSASLHHHAHDSLMSKFVYANGAPELQPAPKVGPSSSGSGSGSVVSTSSRIPTSKNTLRPTSPSKPEPQFATITPTTKSAHNTPLVSPRSPVSASHARKPITRAKTSTIESRPVSMTGEPKPARPKSLTIAEPPLVAKLISAHGSPGPSSEATSPMNPTYPIASPFLPSNPAMGGFASLIQAAEDFAEAEDSKPESLNSPTKSTSQEKDLTDLVATARRERKVQDLQITNASLEAINRTLERQLRKQTAELRRYKRLSRMSLASVGSRVVSGSTADGGGLARADVALDDMSEEQIGDEDAGLEDLEEMNDEDEYNSGSDHSGSLSPDAEAQHAARQKRDERRLEVDLSKHQQLLVDSQKMNQSIKRCLGWTEELIKEGKRALAYKVNMNEVELPGRVLTAEEIELRNRQQQEDAEESNLSDVDDFQDNVRDDDEYTDDLDLRDDSLYGDNPRLDDDLADMASDDDQEHWGKDPHDRDSGIELPADGG